MAETLPTTTTTQSGLAPNVAGAVAYALGPLTGIFFLATEKENQYVRFHAAQSTVLWLGLFVASIAFSIALTIIGFVPVLGAIVAVLAAIAWMFAGFALFVLWIVLMVKAYGGSEWELPLVAKHARRIASPAPPAA
ncbi:MAG TPA: hypothetical protein VFE05_11135 [Longimicrobiaceae bacterium]|jgi:uncharacterized membrane protein|nr:hypothetical protein [Longimicrobiaceae bacterium]